MPSIENKVNLTDSKIKGSNIGNDSTGYNVPFDPALAINAAIIVDATANPILPSTKDTRKRDKFCIVKPSKIAEYSMVITVFIANVRMRLNINFPVNTVSGEAIRWSVKVVPLSSSDTKALDNPDMAEKKITTQYKPPAKGSDILSLPMENKIMLIVTTINIISEFTAYRVRSSDLKSF